jgi:hypothetical protein
VWVDDGHCGKWKDSTKVEELAAIKSNAAVAGAIILHSDGNMMVMMLL